MSEPATQSGEKEYQPVRIYFGHSPDFPKDPSFMRSTLTFFKGPSGVTFYHTHVSLLVPVEVMPDLEQWMARNLAAGETGNEKMVEFLQAKGALLHNEHGPAYLVNKSSFGGDGFPIREEYWVKGVPMRPVHANRGITLGKDKLNL